MMAWMGFWNDVRTEREAASRALLRLADLRRAQASGESAADSGEEAAARDALEAIQARSDKEGGGAPREAHFRAANQTAGPWNITNATEEHLLAWATGWTADECRLGQRRLSKTEPVWDAVVVVDYMDDSDDGHPMFMVVNVGKVAVEHDEWVEVDELLERWPAVDLEEDPRWRELKERADPLSWGEGERERS